MNEVLTNEVLKHEAIISNPVPLGEALLILGGFLVFAIAIIPLSFKLFTMVDKKLNIFED